MLNIHNSSLLQDLQTAEAEGETKVMHVRHLAEVVMPQTAPEGQQTIRRELDALQHDWDRFSTKLNDTESGLQGALQSWEEFDILHDDLYRWLKDMEASLKDADLKSTVEEKEAQLEKLKVR